MVGTGGREHALAMALSRTASVVVTPGNPGMTALSGLSCVPGPPSSIEADLFVIGPEAPLVSGLADDLRSSGRLVFGPGADGARLEGSKAWMKQVLAAAGVPTARHDAFTSPEPAVSFLRSLAPPWVVKTDGLAAGKGVLVTDDLDLAIADVSAKLSGAAFGDAGRRVVIEEGLTGPELSVMAVCDGTRAVALAPAQDFKRAYDGDAGPNTGGMGAYSPVPSVPHDIFDVAITPLVEELRARGIDYRGVLYAGLMLTAQGPKVLEFNVRFGDPEAQVVLPRWDGDVAAVLAAAAAGQLGDVEAPAVSSDAAVCVVLAAPGYPESPSVGAEISGLSAAASREGVSVYAAGVGDGMVTAGGRVLGVTGRGASIAEARRRAYGAVDDLHWPGVHYRRDIALVNERE
ncbi:MAG: phosphoribosylamine--glycine ligase, partial [Acidimicrobiaceae bacterium]|nr:phosphoribosylamine--glycine ligase [Acidimicrobiaceae bacterium]